MEKQPAVTTRLGRDEARIRKALSEVSSNRIAERIWARDHTVWKSSPEEISNRLRWLDCPRQMSANVARLAAFAGSVREAGVRRTLLCGMGGSSLAPEVIRATFGLAGGMPDLEVLDSTVPAAVRSAAGRMEPSRSLFIISTKSGSTVETLSLFKYFYNLAVASTGPERAGERFVAVTDPGSPLSKIAAELRFRDVFLSDPDIGGRYSALSYFGLVPASLIGVDVERLLKRGREEAARCAARGDPASNPGVLLGTVMGEMAKTGRNKLTLFASAAIERFGDWLEQLIAESTGKEGLGIVPVMGEEPGQPRDYGADRLFVYMKLERDDSLEDSIGALEKEGMPVVRINLADLYGLGSQFFLWEFAVAVAASRLGINPFDQPNVEATKRETRRIVEAYASRGRLPEEEPVWAADGTRVYLPAGESGRGKAPWRSTSEALEAFLALARSGDYVAIQAYLPRTPAIAEALRRFSRAARARTGCATTLGWGPRFLHSTGQLHKGGPSGGLFIQLSAADPRDIPIPDRPGAAASSLSFGLLKNAQVMGDWRALISAGRRTIRFHLGADPAGAIMKLISPRDTD